ncbi:MAG: UDP-N-acetylmuramate--L-alanine ligase [Deltaproteobacteria bacterium]|nr:UDP-N-acetylmuramate--L-alanine ligase [Deltaproteobacteria bacterium]
MEKRIKDIHMIGIGGAGMSAIAEVLANLGYRVRGSDRSAGPAVEHLRVIGLDVRIGHAAENVDGAQVAVKSTAIAEDNPEVVRARELGIPVIPRAEMLAELMRLKTGVAVAGTHGKTTTTSFLGTIFQTAGLDPTVIIGGRLNAWGSNALLGRGDYLVAEADESDGSFLSLFPILTVVTNIDADHMDFYKDLAAIKDSFVRFMNSVPFYGLNVVCGDDQGVRDVLPRIKRPCLTYGLGQDNDLRAEILSCERGSTFLVHDRKGLWGHVSLAHPGRHNVLNALAAIGVSIHADIPKEAIVSALAGFGGVGRRFEHRGERNGVLVVDDYGHHPTEIRATLETARRCYPDRRLVVVFQPHRFTRTQALFGEFCRAFDAVDRLLLTEIYPASETPIPGVSGSSLALAIRQVSSVPVDFFEDFDQVVQALPGILAENDLLLTLGAGNVWTVGQAYLDGGSA